MVWNARTVWSVLTVCSVAQVGDGICLRLCHARPHTPVVKRLFRSYEMNCAVFLRRRQPCLSTISFLTSAIALAGLSPFGQVRAQFMIVWQR
jgi:hypothetical protein